MFRGAPREVLVSREVVLLKCSRFDSHEMATTFSVVWLSSPPATISMVTKVGPHRSCLGVPPESLRAVQRYLGACFVAPPLEPEPGIQLRIQIVSQHYASCCSQANLDSTPTSLSLSLLLSSIIHFQLWRFCHILHPAVKEKKISLSCSLPSSSVMEKKTREDVRHAETFFFVWSV